MSFDKVIPSQITEYKLFFDSDTLVKEASDVDFPEGFVYDPDFLYIWARIVSAGEFYGPNKNGDYFPEEELVAWFETFKDAHHFKNHENKNVENAIGTIITVRWNPVMKCVELLKALDKKRAPELARGYIKGYVTDVSMGCKVPYTVCSICGNKARKRSEFCEHVRFHRLQILGNGERVYEINYKPKFHDSSTVLNGAERVAKAFFIVDNPPENVIVSSFRKAASSNGSSHYIRLSEKEMEKVASMQETMHPLLKEQVIEKIANETPMMKKIAELEKELTGKLLNIVSAPKKEQLPAAKQMLEIIKFLTDKRLDEKSLVNIAKTVQAAAKENQVPVAKAFSTLVGVAELMGIELFPRELHTILRTLTDAGLDDDFQITNPLGEEPVYPGHYANGVTKAVISVKDAKDFLSPASLLNFYDESVHHKSQFMHNPLSFLTGIADGDEMDTSPSVNVIRIIHKALNPITSLRSHHPEYLLPRLSVILGGHRPILGGLDAKRDLEMLVNPMSAGDTAGRLAYHMYQNMRPTILKSRFIKLASDSLEGLEKTASKYKPTPHIGWIKKPSMGLKATTLAAMAIPAAYGASAFQKSRKENNRYMSDADNFVADHPGVIAGGAVLAGLPLSRAVHRGALATGKGVKKGVDAIKAPFTKMADYQEFEGIVKIADSLSSGEFNVFGNDEVLKRYMQNTGATGEQASAVKMATLLSSGGLEKEAFEILHHFDIPSQEKGRMLKIAEGYLQEEMDKAAEEFTNNMILSTIGDVAPLGRTLPGRAVDAFVFKKLSEIGKPKEPKLTQEGGSKLE